MGLAEPELLREADRNGLAVEEALEAALDLERVAERVAQVEEGASAVLAFVVAHDRGLRSDRAFDDRAEIAWARERVEQRRGEPERDLERFGHAGRALARGQRRDVREIGDDGRRLVDRPEQVLAGRVIEAGLSADRRIDHRQQRGRRLEEADSAKQRCGGEPGEVADDATAERDDERVAIDLRAERRVPDRADGVERLRALAGAEHDLDSGQGERLERATQLGAACPLHRRVGDEHDRARREASDRVGQRRRRAIDHVHGVAASAERNEQRSALHERDDGLGDGLRIHAVGPEGRVRFRVRFTALLGELDDARERIGPVEERPGSGVTRASQRLLGRGREGDHVRLVEEAPAHVAQGDGAAAERDHARLLLVEQLGDERALALAERGGSFAPPQVGDLRAGALLDQPIRVDEGEPEALGDERSDGALARCGEAAERDALLPHDAPPSG